MIVRISVCAVRGRFAIEVPLGDLSRRSRCVQPTGLRRIGYISRVHQIALRVRFHRLPGDAISRLADDYFDG